MRTTHPVGDDFFVVPRIALSVRRDRSQLTPSCFDAGYHIANDPESVMSQLLGRSRSRRSRDCFAKVHSLTSLDIVNEMPVADAPESPPRERHRTLRMYRPEWHALQRITEPGVAYQLPPGVAVEGRPATATQVIGISSPVGSSRAQPPIE